ncbi:MAG: AAA family ATPase [Alphaproteobacteria bacterium]
MAREAGSAFDGYDGSERKLVTVLFADIVNSSRLVADHDPEDANDLLVAALQLMIDSVQSHGGTVCQVLGDGVMALFGAPHAREDHALRACLAAEAIHAIELPGPDDRVEAPIPTRVGLSSGEVVTQGRAGGVYPYLRAVGEPVHLAARMQALAEPGGTVLSEDTRRLVSDQVQTRAAGRYRLSQSSRPVAAFRMQSVRVEPKARGRRVKKAARWFVGRRGELEAMGRALATAEGGFGQLLSIEGEAGIGKTRLVLEFLKMSETTGRRFVICHFQPADLLRPPEVLARTVLSLMGIEGASPRAGLADAISAFIRAAGIRKRLAVPALLEFLGAAPEARGWTSLDPSEKLEIQVESVSGVLLAVSRRQPLVIVFEDIHWADSFTGALIEELARHIATSRILIIGTHRSYEESAWTWPENAHRLTLEELSPQESAELAELYLGRGGELAGLRNQLIRKTQGNPFFLEECIRTLEETGVLVQDGQSMRLASQAVDLEIPTSIRGVLSARVDRLPRHDRHALMCAAVVGQSFDIRLLGDLLRLSRSEVLTHVNRLCEAGLISETRIVPNLEYSFRHSLIQDVAYETMLKQKRRELHARLVAAIRRRPGHQLPARIELLAHHAHRAGNTSAAFVYCRKAGQRAQTRSRNREAGEYLRKALSALRRLPDTPRNKARSVDVRLELVQSLFSLGQHNEGRSQLLQARKTALDLEDGRRRAAVLSNLGLYHWISGEHRKAIHADEAALTFARRHGCAELEIHSGIRLGMILADSGRYEAATTMLRGAIAKIPEGAIYEKFGLLGVASVGSRACLARSLGELGLFTDALRLGDESICIADASGHVFSQAFANLFVGNVLIRQGEYARSMPLLERGLASCREIGSKLLFPLGAASLGYASFLTGSRRDGLSLLEDAVADAGSQSLMTRLSVGLTWLAEAYLMLGRLGKARECAERALASAEANHETGHEAWARWILSEILAAEGAHEEAERGYLRAGRTAARARMEPLRAHCHLGLARLFVKQRRLDQALREIDKAEAGYRSLGMDRGLATATSEGRRIASVGRELAEPVGLR